MQTLLLDPKGKFSHAELRQITGRSQDMFRNDEVEVYFMVGSHQVCLKRDSREDKSIVAFKMDSTLDMNEKLVTRYNKRK